MSPYLVQKKKYSPISHATLYGLDSNVAKLLANLLTKPSVFHYFANWLVIYITWLTSCV